MKPSMVSMGTDESYENSVRKSVSGCSGHQPDISAFLGDPFFSVAVAEKNRATLVAIAHAENRAAASSRTCLNLDLSFDMVYRCLQLVTRNPKFFYMETWSITWSITWLADVDSN